MRTTAEIANLTVRRIEKSLGKTLEIPPLSPTAQKILQLRSNPDIHVDQLTAIIESDPALAAQVMSWAASPLYATSHKISSIEDAIVRALGFDLVMNLVLGLALGKKFTLPAALQQANITHWKHALYSATLIEGLVRQMPAGKRPEPGLAYLGGLLHNFGHLLLAYLFPHYFTLLLEQLQRQPQRPPEEIEYELLGMTRNNICVSLLHLWQMPEELTTAIAQQNNPGYAGPYANYVRVLQLSRQLLVEMQDTGTDNLLLEQLCQACGLEPAQARHTLKQVQAAEQALRQLSQQMS